MIDRPWHRSGLCEWPQKPCQILLLADEEKGLSCPLMASFLVEVVPDHCYSVHATGY